MPAFRTYLVWESTPRRPKQRRPKGRNQPKPEDIPPDTEMVVALYERAISEAASQRAAILSSIKGSGDDGALLDVESGQALQTVEAWLGSFWDGLTTFLVSS